MSKEYVIHCDESTERGKFYSNFYGGALARAEDLGSLRAALSAKKKELNLHGEIKWDKVTANYLDKYRKLMEFFFEFVELDKIKIRIMFTQNAHAPIKLTDEHREQTYFILYYHFIKLAFGLVYSNDHGHPIRIRLLLDQLPDTKEKADRFKAFLTALSRNPQFRAAKIFLTKDDIADVASHDHDIMQCLDVILGAIQFRLNDHHRVIPKGARRRGKRTRAKEALYKHINSRIRRIYPHFNVGISTGTRGDVLSRWRDPYRHWCFLPSEREYDPSKTKKK